METEQKAVAYYRVSSKKQGRSGLGLEAQQQAVRDFVEKREWEIVDEYEEVESGRKNTRPELLRALAACRIHGAKLVIAKLDRLARDAAFLLKLRDDGVDFVAADMPEANRFTVGILACVAEAEADAASQRTKAALAAAKARGVELGNPENFTDAGRRKGARRSAEKRNAQANRWAVDMAPIVREIRAEGADTLRAIASELEARGVPTSSGRSTWYATTVKNLLERIEDLSEDLRTAL